MLRYDEMTTLARRNEEVYADGFTFEQAIERKSVPVERGIGAPLEGAYVVSETEERCRENTDPSLAVSAK